MKISLTWIKDYVAVPLKPEELAHRLTMAGLEVEKIAVVGKDTVFDLEITPNRPDCLSMLGIAREISAILNKPLIYPKAKIVSSSKKVPATIEDKKDCSRYIGVLIKDVKINATGTFIKDRLAAIGLRSINNVVDITNFSLMENGQPLHAFDYDKLSGGRIIVRRAKAGERIVTIDGVDRALDPSVLVIADAERPVAIAGIMGGKVTEVTEATKNILLESAQFDQRLIRKTTRALGLTSDSAYRFERGVPFAGVETGAIRATDLILKQTGGRIEAGADVGSGKKKTPVPVTVSLQEIESLLGSTLSMPRAKTILQKLECRVVLLKGNTLKVTPPVFRKDLKQKEDIIEEIGRIIGYDNLSISLPHVQPVNIQLKKDSYGRKNVVRNILCGQGFNEIISFSMISRNEIDRSFTDDNRMIKIFNPLSIEQEFLRPSLLPSMLNVLKTNINRGQKDLKIYELGKVYLPGGEQEVVGLLMAGKRHSDWRSAKKDAVEIFDIKGTVELIYKNMGVENLEIGANKASFLQKDQCVAITIEGKLQGYAGKLSAKVLANWDLKTNDIFFAEINMNCVYDFPSVAKRFELPSEFPSVVRDVSLAVCHNVLYRDVERIVRREGGTNLSGVHFIEEYTGDKIDSGYRGLVFSLSYQSSDHTLRDDEINAVHDRICNALFSELGAKRR